MKQHFIPLILSLVTLSLTAANAQLWQPITEGTATLYAEYEEAYFQKTKGEYFKVDKRHLRKQINKNGKLKQRVELEIPMPDGEYIGVILTETKLLPKELKEKFPLINSWSGVSGNKTVYADYGAHGLHIMVLHAGEPIFVDPIKPGSDIYISYKKSDFVTEKAPMECHFDDRIHIPDDYEPFDRNEPVQRPESPTESVSQMKTFRLALACTGEYATFHGGTTEKVMSAMTTTMNRVNGIYRRDVGVQMQFIPNNEEIIFLDPDTDPYSNYSPSDLLRENQQTIDDIIGNDNYDIGHVFSTGGGGLARLRSVCNNRWKAGGETGLSSPIGDPYDIDYVSHEIGHQFGANHTFNNACNGNRNNNTAYEPGSGNTIMAYAGICAPNVQSRSNALFHLGSLEEMNAFIETLSCPEIEEYENTPPEISTANAEIIIPTGTPFFIDIDASDEDGDLLTYAWDQMENDIVTQPPTGDDTSGPLFRSFDPTENSRRYFPSFLSLAGGSNKRWEVVPNVSREILFGITVRDNSIDAPRVSTGNVKVEAIHTGASFKVTFPDKLYFHPRKSYLDLTWEVAGTDKAPFNSASVDIFLLDNRNYEIIDTIAIDVPNNGAFPIPFDESAETSYRILVQSHEHNFFNISDIIAMRNDLQLKVLQSGDFFCPGNVDTLQFLIPGRYEEEIELNLSGIPEGMEYEVIPSVTYGNEPISIVLSDNNNPVQPGDYEIQATLQVMGVSDLISFDYTVGVGNIEAPQVEIKEHNNTHLSVNWNEIAPGLIYEVELARDADFINIEESFETQSTAVILHASRGDNFVRVRSVSDCETTEWSVVHAYSSCSEENLLGKNYILEGAWETDSEDGAQVIGDDDLLHFGTEGGENTSSASIEFFLPENIEAGHLRIPFLVEGESGECASDVSVTLMGEGGEILAIKTLDECLANNEQGVLSLSMSCTENMRNLTLQIEATITAQTFYAVKMLSVDLVSCLDGCNAISTPTELISMGNNYASCEFGAQNEFQYLVVGEDSMIAGINTLGEEIGGFEISLMHNKYDAHYSTASGYSLAVLERAFKLNKMADCYTAEDYKVRLFFSKTEYEVIRDYNSYVDSPEKLGVSLLQHSGAHLNKETKVLLNSSVPDIAGLSENLIALDVEVPVSNGVLIIHGLKEELADVWYRLEAEPVDTAINISWELREDEQLTQLYLERSMDDATFETLDSVIFDGSETYPMDFSYLDKDVESQVGYFYRIKVVDQHKDTYYSPSKMAGIDISTAVSDAQVIDVNIYPNPHSDFVMIEHDKPGDYQVKVYDVNGRLMDVLQYQGARYEYRSDKLSQGVYYLKFYESEIYEGSLPLIKTP